MVQHMLLSMVVPLALALGAPVTLALRTLPAAPRRWLLVGAPLAGGEGAGLPAAGLRPLRRLARGRSTSAPGTTPASRSAFVHQMMHVHLVLVGTLFFWPLMGVDPVPGRVSHPFRVLLTLMTLPFHAFLGVTIMGQTTLIGEEHYLALREGPMGAWLPPALDDQHLAGGILWASGDLIGVLFFAVLFTQWVRSSMKEAAREDRRLDLAERRRAARCVTHASARGAGDDGYDAPRD